MVGVSPRSGLLTCVSCGLVFGASRTDRNDTRNRTLAQILRPVTVRVQHPERMATNDPYRSLAKQRPEVHVEYQWPRSAVVPLAPFMLLPWILIAGISIHVRQVADAPVTSGILVAVLAPLALALTYVALGFLVNRTRLSIQDGAVTVSYGPLPWPGNRRYPADGIVELVCRSELRYRHESKYVINERALMTNWLYVRYRDGREVQLMAFDEPEQALHVEQQIENALDIADNPVTGAR